MDAFAISLEGMQKILDRLKAGEHLYRTIADWTGPKTQEILEALLGWERAHGAGGHPAGPSSTYDA